MGRTVVSPTVASSTVSNDDETDIKGVVGGGATVAFNSMGTGPAGVLSGGTGKVKARVTVGTGAPAIAANNIVITLGGTTRTPRKVYIGVEPAANAPGFHVASVGAGVINIGTKVAPSASSVHEVEVIPVF